MGYSKGFVFTIDAIFCLIIAASAVSILLYVNYVSPASYEAPVGEAYSIMQALSQTTMQQAAQGELWAGYAVDGYLSRQYQWPEYGNNASLASSTPGFAPPGPDVLFEFRPRCPIFPTTVAADGLVFLTTGPSSRCATSELYALNGTTGNVVMQTGVGGPFNSGPMVYDHMVITSNNVNYLNAISESGNLIWSTRMPYHIKPNNGIITMADGFIQVGSAFYYPFNGAFFGAIGAGAPMPIAYGSGEMVALAGGRESAYAASGNTFTNTWNYPSGGAAPSLATTPALGSNYTVAEIGANVAVTTAGGNFIWARTLDSQLQGGPAILGSEIFMETQGGIYGFTAGLPSTQVLYGPTITNIANITPSVAQNLLWAEPSQNTIAGYDPLNGEPLWNVTIFGYSPIKSYYGDIPLAYGNAYTTANDVLFAFGTCKADPYESVLQAVATMYLQGQGGCASMILNESYRSNNYGMFINNQYAPALYAAEFNGQNSVEYSHVVVNDTKSLQVVNAITVDAWVNLNTLGGAGNGEQQIVWKNGGYSLRVQKKGQVKFGDTYGDDAFTNTVINPQGWVNIAGTFNATGGLTVNSVTLKIYINATLQPETLQGTSWVGNGGVGDPLIFGGSGNLFDLTPTNGMISDVQIYNSTLTANQLEQIYMRGPGGLPLNTQNLTGWWPLDGDTNDYGGRFDTGYAFNMTYTDGAYLPPGLAHSFSVSRAGEPIYLTGPNQTSGVYNVSIVNWR